SDHAVFGVDATYDTHLVRFDTGRVAYDEIHVEHVDQPLITLEPTDEVRLAAPGATHTVTATHVDATGVPVPGALLEFEAQREDGTVVGTATATTNASGQAFFAYAYDGPAVLEPGEP